MRWRRSAGNSEPSSKGAPAVSVASANTYPGQSSLATRAAGADHTGSVTGSGWPAIAGGWVANAQLI